MRERARDVPGVAVLFTTPLGMRIDEGLGGTPADLVGARLRPGSRRAGASGRAGRAADGRRGRASRTCAPKQLTGLPQLQIAVNREATARVGLAPGDVIRAMQRRPGGQKSVADVARPAPLRPGRAAARRSARQSRRDPHAADRRARRHARSRSASSPTITQTFGPAAIRREAGTRRIAVEASVTGRDLGGAAAEVRQALWPRS